jgi:hypothetical protein
MKTDESHEFLLLSSPGHHGTRHFGAQKVSTQRPCHVLQRQVAPLIQAQTNQPVLRGVPGFPVGRDQHLEPPCLVVLMSFQ